MREGKQTWMVRALSALASAVYKYPRLFFYPQIFLFVLSVAYTVANLEFSTSRNDLVGSDKKYHQNFLKFKKEFPTQDDIVVVVESENQEKNRQFVERLGAKLELETNIFADVFYKGDLNMLGHKALLFVPTNQLVELKQTLQDYRPFLKQFTQATNLNSLFGLVNRGFRIASQQATPENESMVKALPALKRILDQAKDSLLRSGTPPAPGLNALFGAGDEAERELYITFANGRLYLVTARAVTEQQNAQAVERLRELVAQTQLEVTGLNVGVTGEPVLEVDEMNQSQIDSTWASVISLLLCAGLFIYSYRETGRPLKATASLIIGLGYTMGFTTLVIGHLNILTITFVPILIGLAIDFGVHLITRYEEELRLGSEIPVALERAMVNTGTGIFTGALTTAAAFFAMAFTDFRGIQEMGIICGGGMLLCLVPMMTFLPVLVMRGRQNVLDKPGAGERRARIERIWLNRPVMVIVFTLLLTLIAVLRLPKVYFDYNLLNMQSKGLPAVVFEHKLVDSASKSVLFAAVIANNLEEALRLEEAVKKLPSVSGVDSMIQFLSQDPTDKLKIVREIRAEVSDLNFRHSGEESVNLSELSRTLWALEGYLALGAEFAQKDAPEVAKELLSLRTSVVDFRREMLSGRSGIPEQLARFERALFEDIRRTFETLKNQEADNGIKIDDLPVPLRNRFIGVSAKHLIQVYPKKDVWKRENQEEFVRELRTVDPNVTGTPVQLYEYTTLLKDSYQMAAVYASIAIAIMVLIHFRSLVSVLLAMLPVAIGGVWMIGIMGHIDLPFNPANIMTLPLVIGIGVTSGIHILNRFAEEKNPGILAKSTGKAVLVSGLTTVAGFASLMFAKHQGISSLGLVMTLGTLTCMVAALTFLPSLLQLLIRMGWKVKKIEPSGDNARSALGPEEPR